MKLKPRLLFFTLLFFPAFCVFSQNIKIVTGIVTGVDGTVLPGVKVVVKGEIIETVTDFNGVYKIDIGKKSIINFSYLGYKTKEVLVDEQEKINISLSEDIEYLNEIIVVAQGIKKEKKSLGYSISTIGKKDIEQRAEADIGRILQGKAAGVNVTSTNGITGSGTNIIIRGYSSVSGSNQPLFIVDGVPFDGGTNTQSSFLDNVTESSRFLDLDPSTIENVSVLKGLSATTLYGQSGSNGVILITTKNGSTLPKGKKFEVSFTQSTFLSKAILPKYQDDYGGGFNQDFGFFFSNWGPNFNSDLSGDSNFIGVTPDGTTLINGPLGNISDQSLIVGLENQIDTPYEYRPYDSVEDFFRTGITSTTSINVSGRNEKGAFNMSYTHLDDQGVTPGNNLIKNNFGLGGSTILSNKLTVKGVVNYSTTNFKSPPIAPSLGSGTAFDGGSVFGDLLYTPRSVDLFGLPFQTEDGRSIYYRASNDIQNPRWTVANVKTTQNVQRVFGNLSTKYDFKDWINLNYRIGIDQYTESNSYGQNRGGIDGEQLGLYRTTKVINTIWDHTLSLNVNKDLSGEFNLKSILGANTRSENFERDGLESIGQIAFGVLEHFNFTDQSSFSSFTNEPIGLKERVNTIGVYFDTTLDYNNYLYFNLSGRNDWSSTLEKKNNSLFYPGTSISFIPTTAFDNFSNDTVNYLKLRFGYGTSGGFPEPFSTRNTLELNPRAFEGNEGVVAINTIDDELGNPDLKPELISEFELGVETKLFKRLDFNISVFSKKTTDLITDQDLDFATGFANTQVNIGELKTKGIEIDYNLDVLKTGNFKWNIAGNFYADENTVEDIGGVDQILLTDGFVGEAANYAVEGRPYGVLLGSTVARDEVTGERLVDGEGDYIIDENLSEIGDPNPDWITNFNTTFSYKGFSLYMDWQFRHGGDVYSTTTASLIGRGVVNGDNPIDREALFVLPGVVQQFNEEGEITGRVANTTQITATNLAFDNYGFGANEFKVYDGTTLRLNEVSLAYKMPQHFLENTPFGSLSFKASGFNMWFKAFNFPDDVRFDTNSLSTGVGNGLGIDFITGPSVRRYGVSVQATF